MSVQPIERESAKSADLEAKSKFAPRALATIPDLSPQQELACALRILAREGWSQNLAGHITWTHSSDEGDAATPVPMLANPWGKWWSETSASDICLVGPEGGVLAGDWDVTPAIRMHTELHRSRPDAHVIIHNHPYFATVFASSGKIPEIVDQTGCMFADDMTLVREYTGGVNTAMDGTALAAVVGYCNAAFLVNHGVLVVGETIQEATYRAVCLERVCRLAYGVATLGGDAPKISPDVMALMKESFLRLNVEVYWNGAVRALLRDEPDVLE